MSNAQQMASGHPTSDELTGMAWWNNLRPFDRAYWLSKAGSAAPVDAWNEYQRTQRLLNLRWGAPDAREGRAHG